MAACCRCNRSALCKRCVCVREGRTCSRCLPSRLGRCQNLASTSADPGPVRAGSVCPLSGSGASPAVSSALLAAAPVPGDGPSASLPASSYPPPSASPGDCSPIGAPLPSLDDILRARVPTLRHVPKAARDDWARLVGDVFSSVSSSMSEVDSWCKVFMLARCILANPPRGGRSHWRDTLKVVRTRIQRWREGKIAELWKDVISRDREIQLSLSRSQQKMAPSIEVLQRSNATRARRAVEDGQYRKALQSLTSAGIAGVTEDIVTKMIEKHPAASPPSVPSDPTPPPVEVTNSDVIKALRSFPTGTAPGPSGLRAIHLKEAVLCPSPDRANHALSNLTKFVNQLCAGQAPPSATPYLCGASLYPCQKKSGGLRPIAVGEVLRRLTSKCISRAVQPEVSRILPPLQLGVGVPAGCEAIVHAVSNVLADSTTSPADRIILLVDFSNAFNMVDRGVMFKEIRSRIPSMAAWMESCYGLQPILYLSNHTIHSCCGVQQGDPLGPLGFALALHPILEKIQADVPGLRVNAWYLDDGTLCGSVSDIAAALTIIEKEGPEHGLHLNRSKCLIHTTEGVNISHPSLCDVPVASGGFDLLGTPVGPAEFCEASFRKRICKVQEIVSRLADLQDSQMESTLLRSCLALPKVSYVLRTCPSELIRDALSCFDDSMREAISDIAGCPLTDWAWAKATLPTSLGGLGLRSASLHASAAYISSFQRTRAIVSKILNHAPLPPPTLPSTIMALANAAAIPEWLSFEDIDVPLHQRALSHAIDQAQYAAMVANSPDSRFRALALSSAIAHAGDWLTAVQGISVFR